MVQWQMRLGSSWVDLDSGTCKRIEDQFVRGNGARCSVQQSFIASAPSTMSLKITDMTLDDCPLRRCRSLDDLPNEAQVVVQYWDDYSWMLYDKYSACLVVEAMQYGHTSVATYSGSTAYDITLDPSTPMQCNRASGHARPMRVESNLADLVDDDDDDDDPAAISDDEYMPNEYKCPITQMPMVNPVVASDGHSYEKHAIARWLVVRTARKSPVTNRSLSSKLVPNLALKKLIRDWKGAVVVADTTSDAHAGSTSKSTIHKPTIAKKKRMRSVG